MLRFGVVAEQSVKNIHVCYTRHRYKHDIHHSDKREIAIEQQAGKLIYGPWEYVILQGLRFREGDTLHILVGNTRVSGHVHYEASDENWYCDACPMSIPLQDRCEARFRLELVRQKQGDEDEIMLAELGEVYKEDDWDEDFEHEER